MTRLPPVLARDYRRNIVWPHVMFYVALAGLAAIVLGVMP